MTKLELAEILTNEGVRYHRVNGFAIEPYNYGALLKGRIPLVLARKIVEGVDTEELQISVHCGYCSDAPEKWATNVEIEEMLAEITHNLKQHPNAQEEFEQKQMEYIRQAEQNGKLDDIYVLYMHIDTPEAVKHVIKVIRESGYINQCLWDK